MARRTKFTKQTRERLLELLALGASKKAACESAGISYELLRRWERKGEAGEGPFVGFVASLKKANCEAYQKALASIVKAGEKQWQASAWFLERRYPDEFSKRSRVAHEVVQTPVIEGEYKDPWIEE